MRYPAFATALALQAAALAAVAPAVRAIPPPAAPRSAPSASPVPPLRGATLPFGSTLLFVIDDKIDSGSTKPGSTIRLHLKAPLVVNGITLAPAGAPASLDVITTQHAQSGDVDGAVQIHLEPFALPAQHAFLPIRAFHEYLNIELTSGQTSTRNTTDTIADIFIPGHVLYHAFRRGRQLVLPPGSILRAQTAATIDASNPKTIVLATPPPFVSNFDTPHADLTAPPYYTPAPLRPRPLPKGKPTLPPSPSVSASPSASPAASSLPSPAAAKSPGSS